MDLRKIKDPQFLKDLNIQQLNILAADIRRFLLQNISKTGGHLSSNLGIVELTIALHYVFNSPQDKIFFDVGHQSYVHKILTGRAKYFPSLRKYNGLSGFQKRCESVHDVWEAGHSSTALSAATAMAIARDLDHEHFEVIPVVGDGAIVGGESLEALNHLGSLKNKVIIIFNDNQMSISQSIGGFNNFLKDVRLSNTYNRMKTDYKNILAKRKFGDKVYHATKNMKDFVKRGLINDTIFENFGLDYIGPVDGHDIEEMIRVLHLAQANKKSVVVHVITKKGKGYSFAENDKTGKWHGTEPFYIKDGTAKTAKNLPGWSAVVADHILQWMQTDQNVVTITPAMIYGSALNQIFEKYPDRAFDVGIAEEHALTFTAGLALAHKKPFISVYSSFIQRAYDQIVHDISRMSLPCLCCIDRAGIVGSDGPTHHGVFDLSFMNAIPNIVYFAPKDAIELKQFINTAFINFQVPYFVRIPRGCVENKAVNLNDVLELGSWTVESNPENYDMTVITYGENVNIVKAMISVNQMNIRLINARFIKPFDKEMVKHIFKDDNKPVLVYETDLKAGSLGTYILDFCNKLHILRDFEHIAIENHFSMQGSKEEIYKDEGIDIDTVLIRCKELINGKEKS